MLEYEWLFFDLGSTLIDESKVYERHMRTVADEANVTYEFVYNKALELYKRGKCGYSEMMRQLGVEKPIWTQEDEILYPETKKCLESLKEKYKIGIIANQISGTEDRLKEFGIFQYIDLVIASAEEGVSKPDKRIFEIALYRAKCNPNKAVMIGDRVDNDILPAKALGMGTIWIKQGFGQFWVFTDVSEEPDFSVANLSELMELL